MPLLLLLALPLPVPLLLPLPLSLLLPPPLPRAFFFFFFSFFFFFALLALGLLAGTGGSFPSVCKDLARAMSSGQNAKTGTAPDGIKHSRGGERSFVYEQCSLNGRMRCYELHDAAHKFTSCIMQLKSPHTPPICPSAT